MVCLFHKYGTVKPSSPLQKTLKNKLKKSFHAEEILVEIKGFIKVFLPIVTWCLRQNLNAASFFFFTTMVKIIIPLC